MASKKIIVSSREGGATGTIVIRSNNSKKEVRAVLFSSKEARILRECIEKMNQ